MKYQIYYPAKKQWFVVDNAKNQKDARAIFMGWFNLKRMPMGFVMRKG